MSLLTRDVFRESVFKRDNHMCVICKADAQDAHHIIERRLFSDGGYYIDNGASLCGSCHLKAESTEISCEQIRDSAGIVNIVLPEHLYKDQKYDKWGNIIQNNGSRIPGELFEDESVQKILKPVLGSFTNRVKYPRTYHLPSSPGLTKDDRVIPHNYFKHMSRVVITEKMDGENSTIYNDYYHARSIDIDNHQSKNWMKNFAAKIGYQIPKGWRICGENLWIKHSIEYSNLQDYFLAFSIWNDKNVCLNWDETLEVLELMEIKHVPILYDGPYFDGLIETYEKNMGSCESSEGFVIRTADSFHYSQFRYNVAKWVRKDHVRSSHHWKYENLVKNKLEKKYETIQS